MPTSAGLLLLNTKQPFPATGLMGLSPIKITTIENMLNDHSDELAELPARVGQLKTHAALTTKTWESLAYPRGWREARLWNLSHDFFRQLWEATPSLDDQSWTEHTVHSPQSPQRGNIPEPSWSDSFGIRIRNVCSAGQDRREMTSSSTVIRSCFSLT